MREIATVLSDKEWRDALDDYLYENKISSDTYFAMNERQKDIINEIKKSKLRQKNVETNYRF